MSLATLSLPFFVSLFLALAFTPCVRYLSVRLHWLDIPDSSRKLHARAVPRVGGVAIAAAYLLSLGFSVWYGPAILPAELTKTLVAIIPGAAIIFLTGLLDDLRPLRPWQKLLGQTLGCIVTILLGIQVETFDGSILPSALQLTISVGWLLYCLNAFNLIDGLDGLATGLGAIAVLTAIGAAILTGNGQLAFVAIPLAGALLGFLFFNFHRASIFLGDCGSMLTGFLVGVLAILWSQKSNSIPLSLAPLLALIVPLLDVGLSIARRSVRGVPIFSADRGHIHHRLLDLGFSVRSAVLMLYAVGAIGGLTSLALVRSAPTTGSVLIVLFGLAIAAAIWQLRYEEFAALRKTISFQSFNIAMRQEMERSSAYKGLELATCPRDCWEIISAKLREMGFDASQLTLMGETFSNLEELRDARPCWSATIALPHGGTLSIMRSHLDRDASSLMPLLDELGRQLNRKQWRAAERARASSAAERNHLPQSLLS